MSVLAQSSGRSIRREALYYAFLACGLVLLAVGGVLFAHHHGQNRDRLADTLRSTAQILASNVSATLAFRDEDAAREILSSIRFDPLIRSATLYDEEGARFVAVGVPDGPIKRPSGALRGDTALAEVNYQGKYLGALYLTTEHEAALRRTAAAWGLAFLAAFALAALLAVGLAARFQDAVAAPLMDLARTAREVTTLRDYSLRAVEAGPSEVVALAGAFNTMLSEAGARDEALARQLTELDEAIRRRKAAQESLRQNTREMLRLSHGAGMAEVATGVLHNIGNALNSINVSTELLGDQIGRRAGRDLRAMRGFFAQPPPKAAAVFASHADGAELCRVAVELADHVIEDLERAGGELAALRAGVGHLKDVVARQQSLARSSRREETFDVVDALNEAVLLHRPLGGERASVAPIETATIGPVPPVHGDRGAVVQILVNLLANAREAVAAAAPPGPRVRVTVGPATATHVPLAVEDNGVGIAPDQLVSIFAYGFTTKAGGHGFGLHNSANTARALGGSLRVRSDGPGRGATFILEIPLSPEIESGTTDLAP